MKFENLRVDKIKTVVKYKPDISTWKASDRKDHIIGIIISGVTYHDLGYKNLDLSPDYIYFFNQRDDFVAVTEDPGFCYSIHFTTTEPIDTPSFCKKTNNPEEIIKHIGEIERLWLKRSESELPMLASFYSLCGTIHKLYNAPYQQRDAELMAAKEYIDLHFREKGCLSEAVALRGVSGRRFNDLFKSCFDITPNQYVISKKIGYAKKLLLLENLSVSDVAELSGFSDVYYFSNQFKKSVGVSPTLYVKGIKNGVKP
jgi:AraC-like DNA-binding protein